jgi:tetratricopeptide (TPR) repeat protein
MLDVLEFEDALMRAEQAEQAQDVTGTRQTLERAVSLYGGELLPGCYDEWILSERDRLHQAILRALERLISLLQREHNYESAIDMAQGLLRHDPLHESTYRRLMRLFAARGDRAAALRVYHTCASMLERELGTVPSQATREVYDRLMHVEEKGGQASAAPAARLLETPLIGRKREWAQLQVAWRRISSKGPSLVVFTGEGGIGKTRLAEELAAWASRQGAAIASARCYAAEGELAYAPVTAWLRGDAIRAALPQLADLWLTEVARLVPEVLVERPDLAQPGPLLENRQRQRLFEALARAILATHQPILLLLDDMHWCDRETLEWLHYLFRFDMHSPLLLIGTLRSEEIAAGHPLKTLLTALLHNQQLTEISLGALGRSDTAALAVQLAGRQLNPHIASTIYQETEGNPLFIVETVRAGLIDRHAAGALSLYAGPMLPPTVRAVLDARLEQLSPLAQQVVRLASVIGRAFTFAVLAQASNEDEDALVHALDELWQRRIIREQGEDAYDFSHDKLREASYTSLSGTRRRLLHRDVAHALEQVYVATLDRVSGQIAAHYEHAGLPEQATANYQRAGEAAMQVYAYAEAMVLFRRALALLESTSHGEAQTVRRETTARLHERMGDIHALAGQHDAARDAYQQALTEVPASEGIWQAGLSCKIGNTWEAQRRNEAALHAYTQAESLLGQEPTETEYQWWQQWIEIQRNRLQVHYWLDHVSEMTELIEKTQSVMEQYGSADQRAAFFQSVFLMMIRQQHYVVSDEALGYAQAALTASQESGNTIVSNWACFNLGGTYLQRGNFDEAEGYLRTAATLGEKAGDIMLQVKSLAFLTLLYRRRGQIPETQRSNALLSSLAQLVQDAEFLGMARATSAWIFWRQGDLVRSQADGEAALKCWRQTEVVHPFQWTALWPLIGATLSQNRLAEAVNHAHALLASGQQRLPDTLRAHVEAATSAWEGDQKEAACTSLRQATSLAQTLGYL